jgi:excisionase family DNA binding protein
MTYLNMAQAVRIIDLTKEDLIQLIKDAVPQQQCPPCAESKPEKELLTRKEVSEMLNVSLTTLHDWNKQGVLRAIKVMGKSRVLYKREDIMNRLTTAA